MFDKYEADDRLLGQVINGEVSLTDEPVVLLLAKWKELIEDELHDAG